MFTLSPKSLFSPRFLALPVIALAVIVALAQSSNRSGAGTEVAGPTVVRAVSCSTPGKAMDRACAVARDDLRAVR